MHNLRRISNGHALPPATAAPAILGAVVLAVMGSCTDYPEILETEDVQRFGTYAYCAYYKCLGKGLVLVPSARTVGAFARGMDGCLESSCSVSHRRNS